MTIDRDLKILRESANNIIHHGEFLLSVNKFSDYWIHLREMWGNTSLHDVIASILRVVLTNLSLEYGAFTVPLIYTLHAHTTEEELPLVPILREAVRDLHNDNIRTVPADINLPLPSDNLLPGNYVCFFVLSVHVDFIEEVVNFLKKHDCSVSTIVVIMEREGVSRDRLVKKLGVELIPLIVVGEKSGIPTAILENSKPPYRSMHKYFQEYVNNNVPDK